MLYFVGLGLGDEKDVTLKGLEAIQASSKLFLESYTSVLGVDAAALVRVVVLVVAVVGMHLTGGAGKAVWQASGDCVP